MERNPTDKRIDDLAGRVGQFERRFERFEDKVDGRFDKVDGRFKEMADEMATKQDIAYLAARLDKWGRNINRGVFAIAVGVILKVIGV